MTARRAREIPGRAAGAPPQGGPGARASRATSRTCTSCPGSRRTWSSRSSRSLQTVRLSFYDWDGLTPKKWIGARQLPRAVDDAGDPRGVPALGRADPVLRGLLDRARPLPDGAPDALHACAASCSSAPCCSCRRRSRRSSWRRRSRGSTTRPARSTSSCARSASASLAKTWLGDFTWALPAVGLIGTWITFGLCLVLFLAGAQRIPHELYEAARVDGAGFVREFFAVTLPGTAQRARRRGDADDDHGAAQLRHHLQHDAGRPGRRDRGAVVADVPQRVRPRPRRLRGVDRRRADGDHHRASRSSSAASRGARRDRTARPLHDVRRADRRSRCSRSTRCSRSSSSPSTRRRDLVTGFSLPTTFSLQTFIDAWNEGDFGQGMWGSFLVAVDGHRRLGGAVAVHRLRLRHDALPRLRRCSST